MNELDLNFDFDLDSFDLTGSSKPMFEQSNVFKPKLHRKRKYYQVKYKNAVKLAKDVDISEHARNYCIIAGNFIYGDFIEALLIEKNIRAEKITIATLSLSQNNIDSLANLIEADYIDEMNMIVSDYFYSHERRNLVPYMYDKLNVKDKYQLSVCKSHCKITTIKTHDGRHLVIHGSANLRSSDNIEQIVIEENKELYEFNNQLLDTIRQEFSTIKKDKGSSSKLWEKIS